MIDFYNERRKQLLAVKPNRGQELVSEMEKFFNVTVITQNIDNLHERSCRFFLFLQDACFADKSGFAFVQIKYQQVNLVRIMIP